MVLYTVIVRCYFHKYNSTLFESSQHILIHICVYGYLLICTEYFLYFFPFVFLHSFAFLCFFFVRVKLCVVVLSFFFIYFSLRFLFFTSFFCVENGVKNFFVSVRCSDSCCINWFSFFSANFAIFLLLPFDSFIRNMNGVG